ncbi:hypothetical protein KP509_37G064000 [Ceratopteris richardii]|uniref:Uncharacterized protein n=1 Tax=Ceratopteris richardii TaxID=49495 RepID=A0A8T2Q9D3_CERRI|nr:hypothetical protein KP509_37G064000 [Ceratopteris richardii]
MVGGIPQASQQRPWRPAFSSSSSTSVNRIARCKRHPHQAFIGVCSICLKERLIALAVELEEEQEPYFHVEEHFPAEPGASHSISEGIEDLYLGPQASDRLALQAWQAASHDLHIDRHRLSSFSSSRSRQGNPYYQGVQHLHNHRLRDPGYASAIYNSSSTPFDRINGHRQLADFRRPDVSTTSAINPDRRYKSLNSSPCFGPVETLCRHEDLNHRPQRRTNTPPPAAMAARPQSQAMLSRRGQMEVSPISLTGLDNFITSVKATQADDSKPKKKKKTKKKSTNLWSLLNKDTSSARDAAERTDGSARYRKGNTMHGSPFCTSAKHSRGPHYSSSMREVHDSLCRGDASSLLLSPGMASYNSVLPSVRYKLKEPFNGPSVQIPRSGHWRSSSSCAIDDHPIPLKQKEVISGERHGSSSWLSALFHRGRKSRSKSISAGCYSSPDSNMIMRASNCGRLSVDAGMNSSKSRHDDVLKYETNFKKKYASLLDEVATTSNARKTRKRNTSAGLQKGDSVDEHGCMQCEQVRVRRTKLASNLPSQASPSRTAGGVSRNLDSGEQEDQERLNLRVQPSPQASPRRPKASAEQSNLADDMGAMRSDAYQKSWSGNILLKAGCNGDLASSTGVISPRYISNQKPSEGPSAPSSPVAASSIYVTGPRPQDSEDENAYRSNTSRFYDAPRSRSWSKSWNKALSPILGFKGKAASPARKGSRTVARSICSDGEADPQLTAAARAAAAAASSGRSHLPVDVDKTEGAKSVPQHYSFLSKDYSAFSFYFSPLMRSKRKASADRGMATISSARVNAVPDQVITSELQASSRHSVDGSSCHH